MNIASGGVKGWRLLQGDWLWLLNYPFWPLRRVTAPSPEKAKIAS